MTKQQIERLAEIRENDTAPHSLRHVNDLVHDRTFLLSLIEPLTKQRDEANLLLVRINDSFIKTGHPLEEVQDYLISQNLIQP